MQCSAIFSILKRYEKCCCFSVRTGALIIASLEIIGSIIGIIQASQAIGTYVPPPRPPLPELHDYQTLREEPAIPFSPWISGIRIFLDILNILNIIINGLMLHGVLSNKSVYLKPWLFSFMIGFIPFIIANIGLTIWMIVLGQYVILAIIIICYLLSLFLNYYFLSVVYSVYVDIKENKYVTTV
jgi:hypothetical protein